MDKGLAADRRSLRGFNGARPRVMEMVPDHKTKLAGELPQSKEYQRAFKVGWPGSSSSWCTTVAL